MKRIRQRIFIVHSLNSIVCRRNWIKLFYSIGDFRTGCLEVGQDPSLEHACLGKNIFHGYCFLSQKHSQIATEIQTYMRCAQVK